MPWLTESSYITHQVWNSKSSCLHFLGAGITSICHHTQLLQFLETIHRNQKYITVPYPMELWDGQGYQDRHPGSGSETQVKQGQINVSFPGFPKDP